MWPVTGLLTATAASLTANAMVGVLVPWLVITRTGSAAQAGLVGAVALATAVPALLFGGPLIDRWGRRRVSVGADVLSAVAVAALPVWDSVLGLTLLSMLSLVAVGALFDGPGAAAREAARPDVAAAGGTGLAAINGTGEAVDGAAQIAGPVLAGVGIGLLGAMTSLWVAAGLLLTAACVGWMSLPPDRPPRHRGGALLSDVLNGSRVVWRDRTLRALALLGTLALCLVAPFTLVATAHVASTGESGSLGLITGAFGAGAMTGALASIPLAASLRRRTIVVAGLATAGGGFAVMAAGLGLGAGVWLPAVSAAVAGGGFGPLAPALSALVQQRTEPAVLGRVTSTLWALALAGSPAGLLAAGLLLQAAGPATTLLVIAAGLLAAATAAARTAGLSDTALPHPAEEAS